jgi:hypothetical protein
MEQSLSDPFQQFVSVHPLGSSSIFTTLLNILDSSFDVNRIHTWKTNCFKLNSKVTRFKICSLFFLLCILTCGWYTFNEMIRISLILKTKPWSFLEIHFIQCCNNRFPARTSLPHVQPAQTTVVYNLVLSGLSIDEEVKRAWRKTILIWPHWFEHLLYYTPLTDSIVANVNLYSSARQMC